MKEPMTIIGLMDEALRLHITKRWEMRDPAVDIALIHSELSEALEELRKLSPPYDVRGIYYGGKDGKKPEGFATELADVMIRVAQVCAQHGVDLEGAIIEKMAYNWTRPERHGGKAF